PALVRRFQTDFGVTIDLPEQTEQEPTLLDLLAHLRSALAGLDRMSVQPDAYLGAFAFAKVAMWADLEADRKLFARTPSVCAIGGRPDALMNTAVAVDLPPIEEFDRRIRPESVFQVLDADASQQEAIEAVKGGASLVIQGPPGTGKSQTITNIIAETLA